MRCIPVIGCVPTAQDSGDFVFLVARDSAPLGDLGSVGNQGVLVMRYAASVSPKAP